MTSGPSGAVAPDGGHHVEFERSGGSLRWLFALVALLGLLGVAGYQFGIYDQVLERLNLPQSGMTTLPALPDGAENAVASLKTSTEAWCSHTSSSGQTLARDQRSLRNSFSS